MDAARYASRPVVADRRQPTALLPGRLASLGSSGSGGAGLGCAAEAAVAGRSNECSSDGPDLSLVLYRARLSMVRVLRSTACPASVAAALLALRAR